MRFFEQFRGEGFGRFAFGYLRPHIDGCLRRFTLHTDRAQRIYHQVTTLLIECAHLFDAVLRTRERHDSSILDGGELSGIEVVLHGAQRLDGLRVSACEPDAPAGHVVRLAQAEELDAAVHGVRALEDGGGFVAVVAMSQ